MSAKNGIVSGKVIPVSNHNFVRSLFESFQRNPNATAIVDVSSAKEYSYEELRKKAEQVARHLLKEGVRKGDVFGIFSPNSVEWIVVFLGIVRIGAIPAGINCLLTSEELHSQLTTCRAKYIYTTVTLAPSAKKACSGLSVRKMIVDREYADCLSLEAMLKDNNPGLPRLPLYDELNISPEDPCMIIFSSGTTGPQKAVLISHRALDTQKATYSDPQWMSFYPKAFAFAPLSHIFGLFGTIYWLVASFTVYMMDRFDFATYLRLLQDLKIENIGVVPPIAVLLAKSPEVDKYNLVLKSISIGAAPVSEDLEKQLFLRFPGIKIVQAYGLTECTSLCCYVSVADATPGVRSKPNTVGPPSANVQMKVVDLKTGEPLGPNTNGEICVNGPIKMLGYLGNPTATAATIDKEGWLHTGDIGYYDEDGYFYIVDRLKELIKYNAYQVAPSELEGVLLSHPEVADAGVFGILDAKAGELPAALVVKKPNAKITERELELFVAGRVAPFKRLRGGVQFVDAIPRTASGKILRNEMKRRALHGKL